MAAFLAASSAAACSDLKTRLDLSPFAFTSSNSFFRSSYTKIKMRNIEGRTYNLLFLELIFN